MNHKELDVWKSSMLLAEMVYKQTTDFPKHEQFGITSQLRRAAVSVPTNVAEGSARKGNKEFVQFLYISLGSLTELETLIILSRNIDYLSEDKKDEIIKLITSCSKLTHGLIKYLKNKQ
jgi:four helix bundle protein